MLSRLERQLRRVGLYLRPITNAEILEEHKKYLAELEANGWKPLFETRIYK